MKKTSPLSRLCDAYWQLVREEQPLLALMAGQPLGLELMREAPEDHTRRAQRASEILSQAREIDPAVLDAKERVTLSLLRWELELIQEAFLSRAHNRPSLFPLGPEFLLSYASNSVALLNQRDAEDWLTRLSSIPKGLDGTIRSLQAGIDAGIRYPRLHLEGASGNVRGILKAPAKASPLHGPFLRAAGRSADIDQLAERGLEILADAVIPALTRYADFIDGPLSSVARDSISCCDDIDGRMHYEYLVRRYTTISETPEALHVLGLAEVERLEQESKIVAAAAGFGDDVAGFRRALNEDPDQYAQTAEALRQEIEVLSKRIEPILPGLFGNLPRITYGVQSIPVAISERMPPAYAQPSPADRTSAGIHWITSHPAKLPRYMHLPLALHEAWPGHLMHLALMQEQEHLPDFRRHGALGYSACLEGWALYCEGLGEDMALYDTPQKRYGRLEMEMWRAVRLVVDTGLHVKGWSREEAIEYAVARMALPRATLEAEIDRYISMPGQALAYQLGNRKFRELRKRATEKLGSKLRLRDFHDALMAAGPVTLPVLESVINDWIDAQAA
ncbi:DUF885 domain-containing protein [Ramlibacter tataouinensis]|uniref:DUF885 domain-containing protein n=1 Tax=Ramlibacter tataouinensis TaxID=94132 RepID=UPI0009ECF46E|nr:DUF885 domain-containing protein [Ramlibacter tataouinensis]